MDPRPRTISEIEFELQRALASLREIDRRGELQADLKPLLHLAPPDGASVHVSLRQRDSGRSLGQAGPASTWASRGNGAWIVYETPAALVPGGAAPAGASDGSGDPLRDFVFALDHVEKDPHLRFVSLKWFRDTYLPKRGYGWATDPDIPRQMVHEAAETEMILTDKVPNPKTPEFPVTTIRLNRDHVRVLQLLAENEKRTSAASAPASSGTAPEPAAAGEPDEPTPSVVRRPRRRGPAGEGPRERSVQA